jgi:signal-transduction protein with cAMP-binding, CBS, and nucleotidyltransferase domain
MSAAPATASAPSLIEKLFSLRQVRPFDRLPPDELALLAEVARHRNYAPGEVIHPGDVPLPRLLVVVGGRALDAAGAQAGPIVGLASLVNNLPAPRLTADPAAGARVLDISRRHFFTLARECPEFVLGLIELGERGRTP